MSDSHRQKRPSSQRPSYCSGMLLETCSYCVEPQLLDKHAHKHGVYPVKSVTEQTTGSGSGLIPSSASSQAQREELPLSHPHMIWMEQELREFAGPSPKDEPCEGSTALEQHVMALSDSRGAGKAADSCSGPERPPNQPNSQPKGGHQNLDRPSHLL